MIGLNFSPPPCPPPVHLAFPFVFVQIWLFFFVFHRFVPLLHPPSLSISHRFLLQMLNAKLLINLLVLITFSVVIFPILSIVLPSVNCPCQNYGTETSCTKVFQNREFLCQSAVFRNEALKCANTCQMCCERPEFKCSNKKDETTCQRWKEDGWCTSKRSVMANFCPNKCGLCNSITEQQQNNECRDKDETLCNKILPNDCASENVLVRYKMHTKCPKSCGRC